MSFQLLSSETLPPGNLEIDVKTKLAVNPRSYWPRNLGKGHRIHGTLVRVAIGKI
jgi:hypothetical protein